MFDTFCSSTEGKRKKKKKEEVRDFIEPGKEKETTGSRLDYRGQNLSAHVF